MLEVAVSWSSASPCSGPITGPALSLGRPLLRSTAIDLLFHGDLAGGSAFDLLSRLGRVPCAAQRIVPVDGSGAGLPILLG